MTFCVPPLVKLPSVFSTTSMFLECCYVKLQYRRSAFKQKHCRIIYTSGNSSDLGKLAKTLESMHISMVSGPQIVSKMAPRRPREVPGEPRGSLASPGVSREGPGEPFGHPRAPAGEPFGLHFGCLFGYVFLSNFEVTFLRILGRILAPFGLRFGSQNRPRRPLGAKRSIFKNPCFT